MSAPSNRCRAAILLLLAAASPALAQTALRIPREQVLSLDMVIDDQALTAPATQGAPGVAWRQEVRTRFPQGVGADNIRVHVHFATPPNERWSLRFLSANGAQVDGASGVPGEQRRDVWSRDVPDGVAIVEMRREAPGATPAATIEYAYRVIPTEQESIHGKRDLWPIADAPYKFKRLGRAVARLRFMIKGEGQATCTAFVVGTRLLLTNNHCISNDYEVASALVDFNYDTDTSPASGVHAEKIIAWSHGLDYTLFSIASDVHSSAGRLYFATDWTPVSDARSTPASNVRSFVIIQHSSGSPKHISIVDCILGDASRVGVQPGDFSDFGHECDTLGGSSGSPVLDYDTGLIVGLHHFGFVEGVKDAMNQAVVYTRVLTDIEHQDKAAYAEVTLRKPTP